MSEKMPSLTLTDIRVFNYPGKDFQIISMKNTTAYGIGDYIEIDAVDKLIKDGWSISIKGN